MSIKDRGIIGVPMQGGGEVVPEGVSFDGVNDYLSRSTDLVGNVDSKTFTFSCWVYFTYDTGEVISTAGDYYFNVNLSTSAIEVQGRDSSNAIVFRFTTSPIPIVTNTWSNLLISLDLTNSSKRYVYLNDVPLAVSWTSYVNALIDFTRSTGYRIAYGVDKLQGRLSHLFLDYTYRDLSIEANRRLFITADGKPADGLELVDKYLDNKFSTATQTGLSTVGFCLNDDDTKIFVTGYIPDTLYEYTYNGSSITYTGNSFNYSAYETANCYVKFSNDGMLLFLVGTSSDKIHKFSLSSSFSLTGVTFVSSVSTPELNPTGFNFNNDGTKIYISYSSYIKEYTLPSAYDISNLTFQNSIVVTGNRCAIFNSDGSEVTTVDTSEYLKTYTLTTNYSFNSYTLKETKYIGSEIPDVQCIQFGNNGYSVLASSNDLGVIVKYNLSTPYDISTAVYGIPAGTPTAPILYLPMKDAATAHINYGSGNSEGLATIPTTVNGIDIRGGTGNYLREWKNFGTGTKTLTFSLVMRLDASTGGTVIGVRSADGTKTSYIAFNGTAIYIAFFDHNNGGRIEFTYSSANPIGREIHLCGMIDINNISASKMYINGNEVDTASNTNGALSIFDTSSFLTVGSDKDGVSIDGFISDFFMDTSYIDLSQNNIFWDSVHGFPIPIETVVSANNLTPLLAFPLTYGTETINIGTGGNLAKYGNIYDRSIVGFGIEHNNFVQNGTLATADRGANQDNCVASYFDGTADYLSNTTLRASSSNFFTLSLVLNNSASTKRPFHFDRTGVACTDPVIDGSSSATGHEIAFRQVDESLAVSCKAPSAQGKTTHISIAFDITNSSSFRMVVNGVVYNTYTTFVQGATIAVSSITNWFIGRGASFFQGNIGELYFDTKYIDLTTNNPFWSAEDNKPIPVRKAMENLGSNPLICMPISADNPGKNYGTGGDFTLNGGGLVGARGASEYISRGAKFDGTTGYLNSSNIGASDSKTFSAVVAWKPSTVSTYQRLLSFENETGTSEVFTIFQHGGDGRVYCQGENAATTRIFDIKSASALVANNWYVILISSNALTNSNYMFVTNGINNSNATTQTNDFLDIGGGNDYRIGVSRSGSNFSSGTQSFTYFTTDYIDFSQESNRNLFVNQLGYPRDLTPEIEAGNIPTPLIYLPFDDTSNLGKNLGTGGDFTVNGTVTAGADFSL